LLDVEAGDVLKEGAEQRIRDADGFAGGVIGREGREDRSCDPFKRPGYE